MKKVIIASVLVIMLATTLAIGATLAAFSDVGNSNDSTFAAGTLDLKVDGADDVSAKITASNMKPSSQIIKVYTLNNTGSIDGYLNIKDIVVTNNENTLTSPEQKAGDASADIGELGDVLNIKLFWDNDGDGWVDPGEDSIYQGSITGLSSNYTVNKLLAAGTGTHIGVQINWWDTANDNKAQSDTLDLDVSFELSQNAK